MEEIALSHSAKLIYFIVESGIYLRPSAFTASSVGPEKPFARVTSSILCCCSPSISSSGYFVARLNRESTSKSRR